MKSTPRSAAECGIGQTEQAPDWAAFGDLGVEGRRKEAHLAASGTLQPVACWAFRSRASPSAASVAFVAYASAALLVAAASIDRPDTVAPKPSGAPGTQPARIDPAGVRAVVRLAYSAMRASLFAPAPGGSQWAHSLWRTGSPAVPSV